MHEDEAILLLLDLGQGASHRPKEVLDTVTEIQESCGITEVDEREIKHRLTESEHVSLQMFSLL